LLNNSSQTQQSTTAYQVQMSEAPAVKHRSPWYEPSDVKHQLHDANL